MYWMNSWRPILPSWFVSTVLNNSLASSGLVDIPFICHKTSIVRRPATSTSLTCFTDCLLPTAAGASQQSLGLAPLRRSSIFQPPSIIPQLSAAFMGTMQQISVLDEDNQNSSKLQQRSTEQRQRCSGHFAASACQPTNGRDHAIKVQQPET